MEIVQPLMGGDGGDAISVLLVDENPTFLRITTRVVEEYFSEDLTVVGMSPGGSDALDQAQRLKPRVILLGWHQQDLSRSHIISRLRALLPEAKIIVLGQFNMHTYEQEAIAAGADAFLSKVMLNSRLLSTVRRVCHAVPLNMRTVGMSFRPLEMDFLPVF